VTIITDSIEWIQLFVWPALYDLPNLVKIEDGSLYICTDSENPSVRQNCLCYGGLTFIIIILVWMHQMVILQFLIVWFWDMGMRCFEQYSELVRGAHVQKNGRRFSQQFRNPLHNYQVWKCYSCEIQGYLEVKGFPEDLNFACAINLDLPLIWLLFSCGTHLMFDL
jgi:hypothetical protein